MPPKAKPSSSQVYLVISSGSVTSVHASLDSANEDLPDGAKVEVQQLVGGSVQVDEKKAAAKPKAAAKKDEAAPPKPKTKTPAEQRAANASKGTKATGEDLPENVQALLDNGGNAMEGLIVVVTGVPPTLGRKTAEKLVEAHGGKLGKSITGKTNYVVVGNDAGPKKLEQIAQHEIETLDEDGLIELLEAGGSGAKRGAEDDDEKPAKAKKQKK